MDISQSSDQTEKRSNVTEIALGERCEMATKVVPDRPLEQEQHICPRGIIGGPENISNDISHSVLSEKFEQPAADNISNSTTGKMDPHSPAEALVLTRKSINFTGTTSEETPKMDSIDIDIGYEEQYRGVTNGAENISYGGSNFIVNEKFEPPAVIMKIGITEHADPAQKILVDSSTPGKLISQPGVGSENPLIAHVDECPEDKCKNSRAGVLVLPSEDACTISLSECGGSSALDKPESFNDKKLGSASEDAPRSSNNGNLDPSSNNHAKDSVTDPGGSNSECMTRNITIRESKPLEEDARKNTIVPQSEPTQTAELKGVSRSTPKEKRTYKKRFRSTATDRILRSREKPEAPEPSTGVENASTGKEKKRKKRRRKRESAPDEFSRIRTHLRYILNRIGYEQNLIDAYSGEGWKGLSLEKLKPEKELQRATSEILRCKLKIRELFQRLNSLCGEGSFPESLFDSKGQIDSEDIYCAKCGSKDLSADNDIILCDGACDRGFHQLCLVPPLLSEEIPPGDESWLCPGCECKDDCLKLLNDSQGMHLSLSDSWEKVFPEAAATAAAGGNTQNEKFGYPSDDSEDNDYDPDNVPADENVESEELSSNESDFTSTSEEFEAVTTNDQLLGLPSDDSEDAEFDPDAQDHGEEVDESFSSDFMSDSEDLDMGVENIEVSGKGSKKNESTNNDPVAMSEADDMDSAPVSSKRHLERLDYKKLYDETFKDGGSDSSNDEDWTDAGPPTKRRSMAGKAAPESGNGKSSISNGKITATAQKQKLGGMNDSRSGPCKDSSGPSSTGRKGPYKRMGDAVTQGLYQAFKENQYPDRSAKENLAKLLGLTYQKVDKWFGNARWSWRHSEKEATIMKVVSEPSPKDKGLLDPSKEINENGVKITESPQATGGMTGSMVTIGESSQKKTVTPNANKRKGRSALGSELMPNPPAGTSRRKRERKPDLSSTEASQPSADPSSGQKSVTLDSPKSKSKSVLNSEVLMPPTVTPGGQRYVSPKSRSENNNSGLGCEELPKPSAGSPSEQKSVTPKSRGRRKKSEAPKPSESTQEAQGAQTKDRYQTRSRESGS